jgi:hypothetical protein
MQPEKGASKYEIYQDTTDWLRSLPVNWDASDLTDNQRAEIDCWFSSQGVTTMRELIRRLQHLADANWDDAPPRDTNDEEPPKSWLESLPKYEGEPTAPFGLGEPQLGAL